MKTGNYYHVHDTDKKIIHKIELPVYVGDIFGDVHARIIRRDATCAYWRGSVTSRGRRICFVGFADGPDWQLNMPFPRFSNFFRAALMATYSDGSLKINRVFTQQEIDVLRDRYTFLTGHKI